MNLAPTLEQPDLSRCDERVVDEQWSCDLVLDADPVVLVVLAHDPDARDDSEGDTAEPDPCDVCFHWAPDDIVTDIRSGNLPDGRYSSTVSVAAETRLHNRRLFLDVTDGPNNLAIDWRICHPAVDPGGCLGVK